MSPCKNCLIGEFLRKKLSEADYAELLAIVGDGKVGTKGYSKENPVPLDHPITILRSMLPVRAYNCFLVENLTTIGHLVERGSYDLSRTPNIGKVSMRQITEALESLGRSFKT